MGSETVGHGWATELNWGIHFKTILVIDEYWSIFIGISQHNWSLRVGYQGFIAWVQSKGIAGCTCVKPVILTLNLTGKLMNLMGDAQYIIFSSVQLLSCVWLFATPWITARQASLSITNSQSPPKPMSIELVMPSNHLILCHPFSSCPQSFPSSGSFQMTQLFASGGQNIGVSTSTSVVPMNTQDWSPLVWTGWISLQSKGLERVFSSTVVQKHKFFGAQLSL